MGVSVVDKTKQEELRKLATQARLLALDAVYTAKSGHLGGSFSIIDALTVLYFNTMRIDPQNSKDPDRDRFVLSKGHCSPALYAVLALRGYFPTEDMKKFRSIHYHMSGHVEMNHVNGVDMSAGSLGQGLSAAIGMALAGKLDGKDYRVYAAMGDGEIAEGQIWEASMAAPHYHLDNLCAMVDVNGLQIDGPTDKVMSSAPLGDKFRAFGWHVIDVNGHDYEAMANAFEEAATVKGQPTMVLLHTVKGKGVSFMENQVGWHGKAPNEAEYQQAYSELSAELEA
jgi:transketolase